MAPHNGWANWETWQILLWCDNEEAYYHQRRQWQRQMGRDVTGQETEWFFRKMFPKGTPDMQGEPLGLRLMREVDWQEIADALNSERLE